MKSKPKKNRQLAKWGTLLLCTMLFFVAFSTKAQTVPISGTVTDASTGMSIPGASVYVKGTQNGTSTDIDGKFTLNTTANDKILVVSFMGYTTKEVEIVGAIYSIELEPETMNLEEVVVTALGIKREKKALGYSVGEVNSESITNSRESNVVSALSGKVAGVVINTSSTQPGSAASIMIRGNSSISFNSTPLMVIDGVPFINSDFGGDVSFGETGNTAVDLDPSNIESISVLKGAAASALYGSMAGNGVIIINTKSGKLNSAPEITFSHTSSFDKIYEIPLQKKWSQGSFNSATGVYEYMDGETQKTSASWGPRISSTPGAKYYDRWNVFETGYSQENSLNVRGGTEKATYAFNVSQLHQQGVLEPLTFDRYSITTNFTYAVNEKLTLNASMGFTNSSNDRLFEGYSNSSFMNTLLSSPNTWNPDPLYDSDGVLRLYRGGGRNPYKWVLKNQIREITRNRFMPTVGFEYKIIPGMRLTAKLSIDSYNNIRKDKQAMSIYDMYNGTYNVYENTANLYNTDIILFYDKKINDAFTVNMLAGYNLNASKDNFTEVVGTDFILDKVYNTNNCQTLTPNEGYSKDRSISAYGQATVSYKNMLYYTFTGRNDWTSSLPIKNNSYFYPSHSLGFVFSELLKEIQFLNFGKARLSYSVVGNDMAAYYCNPSWGKTWTGWSKFAFPFNGVSGYSRSTTALNPDIANERYYELEFGLETKMFNNRLGLEVSLYKKHSDNQIMFTQLAESTGYDGLYDNVGKIKNRGIELLITGTPIKTKDFEWNVAINWSKNVSEVVRLTETGDPIQYTEAWAVEGKPLPIFYNYGFLRDKSGNIVVSDVEDASTGYTPVGYPIIDYNKKKNLGKAEPDWSGGIRNTFTYKNITLSAFIDMRFGGHIFNGSESYLSYYGMSKSEENRPDNNIYTFKGVAGHYAADGVSAETTGKNTNTCEYQKLWQNYMGSTVETFIQKSDFVKLREISLSYQLPQNIIKRMGFIKGISLNFTGRNLWRWVDDDFTGADPEGSNYASSNNFGGYSFYMFPSTKTYSFGLTAKF
ncbi:MAG: SusC/RagA family TonB-linked outer membrane protein [Bacteroidales bacterium]